MLCYSVKLPPAYFLKKIKGTQCILSFLPGCLRSYLIATVLSQRAPAIFLFPTNRARGAVRHGGYFIPSPWQRCYDPSRDLKSQGKFRVTDFKGQSKLLKKVLCKLQIHSDHRSTHAPRGLHRLPLQCYPRIVLAWPGRPGTCDST